MKVAIVAVALLLACCSAQLTSDEISKILSLHNTARANAVPAPLIPLKPLVWDNTLATYAQNWANQCKITFSTKFFATLYGENAIVMRPSLDLDGAFKQWYGQGENYKFASNICASSSCASFFQIMSANATSIGCGVAKCSSGVFLVCDYTSYQYSGVAPYTAVSSPAAPVPTSPTTSPQVGASGYASIDYRGTKAVLAAHDQKQCGSCWAFSTTAIIEGQLGLQGHTGPLLSDQNVLDCSTGGSCNGGWTVTALKGMVAKGGIDAQSAYPYTAAQGTCVYNSATSQGKITQYGQTQGDFASIYNALVAHGPVGIAVFADSSWYPYKSGVISSDSSSINHAVTVVGYDSAQNAWIVKNSWGASWGISGFFYLSAAHPAGANMYGAFWAK